MSLMHSIPWCHQLCSVQSCVKNTPYSIFHTLFLCIYLCRAVSYNILGSVFPFPVSKSQYCILSACISLLLLCYYWLPDIALSVSNVEAEFNGTQFKTDDNVDTALKLEVNERALTYRNKRQEKSSCAIVCFSTHTDYIGKSLHHRITFSISLIHSFTSNLISHHTL
jgi:hypothetical protein